MRAATSTTLPQALAAVDLALWDRAGRARAQPVAELLSDDARRAACASTRRSTATDRAGAAEQAAAAVSRGFRLPEAEGRAWATTPGGWPPCARRPGRATALRLDANGAWGVEQAVRRSRRSPRPASSSSRSRRTGCEVIARCASAVAVRVAIDETAAEPGALGAGVADAVCLKISRCGGIGGLLAAAALVRASGAEAYLASTLRRPARHRGRRARRRGAGLRAGRSPTAAWRRSALFEDLEDRSPVRLTGASRPGESRGADARRRLGELRAAAG